MPSNIVKTLSKKSGKSENEVEKLWKKAEGIVKNEYNISKENDRFYALVVGILKKMLKITEKLEEEPSITTSTAGIGAGQDGSHSKYMGLVKRNKKGCKCKEKGCKCLKPKKVYETFREYLKEQKKPTGKTQITLYDFLTKVGKGKEYRLLDIQRNREFLGIDFGKMQNASKQLANKGLINYNGSSLVSLK